MDGRTPDDGWIGCGWILDGAHTFFWISEKEDQTDRQTSEVLILSKKSKPQQRITCILKERSVGKTSCMHACSFLVSHKRAIQPIHTTMSHCHDEAHAHGHGHGHGHDDHDHDHDEAPDSDLVHESLYQRIDHDNVVCLNESELGQGRDVLKPWHEKMDDTKVIICRGTIGKAAQSEMAVAQRNTMSYFT